MRTQFDRVGDGEWESVAAAIIQAHMKAARLNYIQLAERLRRFGHDDLNKNLSARVNRGRFSAVFMLQCLSVLGIDALEVPVAEDERA